MFRFRLLILNAVLLLTLLCGYWGRRLQEAPIAQKDFLKELSLPFHNWTTQDLQIDDKSREQLQPDSVLIRRYKDPETGEMAELAVIAGHHKKSVHAPGFCLMGDGWETMWQKQGEIHLKDRTVPAIQALVVKDRYQMLLTYFFTNGEFCTRSLVQFQGAQFLQRLRGEVPEGALVRITVFPKRDEESAKVLMEEFAQAMIPKTLSVLNQARVSLR